MIATDDDEITEFVRMLLRHGGKDKYNVDHIGYNARLDTLQAAVLLAKLDFIDKFNKKRRDIAKKYTEGLKDCNFITLPSTQPATEINSNNPLHVYHQYTIRTEHRDELQTFLKDNGISTMVYYPVPLHKMKVFNGRANVYGTLAHAEQAARTVLSLPIEPLLADEEIDYVISTVRRFR